MQLTPEQVKGRIKNVAKENKADARTLMRIYMMERFLERVANSQYKDNFIIKGGMLVTAMVGVALRSTMDIDAVVTQNHIAVRAHFNDAVQHIRVRRPAVQYHVIFFAAFRPFWDYGKQVSPLPEHRLHTHAPDAIGQKAILRKTFFQCELTHPAHRFFSGCQAPYPDVPGVAYPPYFRGGSYRFYIHR